MSNQNNVYVLGAAGMIGSTVTRVISKYQEFHVTATIRDPKEQSRAEKGLIGVAWKILDVEDAFPDMLAAALEGADWVINCIGIIKPYIHDDNESEVKRAIKINSLFPHRLAIAAEKTGAKVIQIATDCVYSGEKGNYVESDPHDALDVYGKTKSLGEVFSPALVHLRDSVVGPEIRDHFSLLDWFLGQKKGARVDGYANHYWNGVTSFHYAKLCHGIMKENLAIDHLQHIVPASKISKSDLLRVFAKEFKREDIAIVPSEAPDHIDRTLATEKNEQNTRIWRAAGYDRPPTIEAMVAELAEYHASREKGVA